MRKKIQCKATITASWVYKNKETKIDSTRISYVMVDHDYDNNNMPVLYMIANIQTSIYNKMVEHSEDEDSRILLTIKKYNTLEDNPIGITDIKDQFYYFLPTDSDYNEDIASMAEEHTGSESSYSRVTIGLVKPSVIDDIRRNIPDNIYKDITKSTLVYLGLDHVKKLCINQMSNKNIDCVVMPPMSGVTEYLKYIDSQYGIYDLGYRFFHDFQITYMLNESGKYIPNGTNDFSTVNININDNMDPNATGHGITIDDAYIIDVPAASSNISINKNTKTAVNTVIQIGVDVGASAKTSIGGKGSKVEYKRGIRSQSRLTFNLKKNDVTVTVTKSQVDDSFITPNKIYKVKNYDKYKEYDGRYILARKQVVYENKDGDFIPTVGIHLRKKVEL